MSLTLKKIGQFRDVHDDASVKPVLFSAQGLSPENYCLIGYAGVETGKDRWSLSWYKDAKKVSTPDGTFASPEEALAEVEKILSSR